MIVVTIFGVVCAFVQWRYDFVWQRRYDFVWQRKAMMRRIALEDHGIAGINVDPVTLQETERLPWIRRLLGDSPINGISLPADTPAAERAAIRALFPEARLWAVKNSFTDTEVPFPDEPTK